MAIPSSQSLTLPLLKNLQDGKEHKLQDLYRQMAEDLQLTKEDIEELLPSGSESKFNNRVRWAKTYLEKGGFLTTVSPGNYVITKRGIEVLESNPNNINVYPLEFDEDNEFSSISDEEMASESCTFSYEITENDTPEEIVEKSDRRMREELSAELLSLIKECSPEFLEKLVVDLLLAMGYGDAGQAIGRRGDEGIDGIIKEDILGLDTIYIQAKRWNHTIGRPEVQAFAGSLEGQRAKKGVFITTSKFTNEAKEYVQVIDKKITLIDGECLTQLMIDYNLGVSEYTRFIVKRVDREYFGVKDVERKKEI
ncbi:restriction endonuclease [Bacillus suaedaesalsae]|uniref:Restriction endonuclease n=1 Tax=Bacillus suaedaesalsae TaxID=2810349 RepID=A0ABS2DG23_9BACI|nr:restriction endonuclease [Bacillus suaedaesalsae]